MLDPFFGTGTTGVMAQRLGRHWIGIEREADYIELARKRLKDAKAPADTTLLTTPSPRTAPRVPFGAVVERGLLRAGDVLFDQRRRFSAKIHADGSIAVKGVRGSIHKIGARVQDAPACNGWTFWHYDSKGEATPIDELRERIRGEMGSGRASAAE